MGQGKGGFSGLQRWQLTVEVPGDKSPTEVTDFWEKLHKLLKKHDGSVVADILAMKAKPTTKGKGKGKGK